MNPGLTYIYSLDADGITPNSGNSASNVRLPANWEVEGMGNFNDDGIADLLASNTVSRELLVFLSSGTAGVISVPFLTTMLSGWEVAHFQGMGVSPDD